MTDKEVMQMALGALNNFDKGNHGMRWQAPIIKALRAALAQPEPAECDGGQCGIGGYCKQCPKTQPEPDQMTSSSIARARAVAGLLRERNIQTWDDTDREAVFAIDALVSFASMLLNHRLSSVRAQPEPEPVAYGFQNTAVTGRNRWLMLREEVPTDDQYDGQLWTPLYTAPLKKEWVGLTDEEIIRLRHLYDPTAHWSLDMFARIIEAKIKEKKGY